MRASKGVPPASSLTSTWAELSATISSITTTGKRFRMLLWSSGHRLRLTSLACTLMRSSVPGCMLACATRIESLLSGRVMVSS